MGYAVELIGRVPPHDRHHPAFVTDEQIKSVVDTVFVFYHSTPVATVFQRLVPQVFCIQRPCFFERRNTEEIKKLDSFLFCFFQSVTGTWHPITRIQACDDSALYDGSLEQAFIGRGSKLRHDASAPRRLSTDCNIVRITSKG